MASEIIKLMHRDVGLRFFLHFTFGYFFFDNLLLNKIVFSFMWTAFDLGIKINKNENCLQIPTNVHKNI